MIGRRAPVDVRSVLAELSDRGGDRPIAAVAERQHGLTATGQLEEVGLKSAARSRRVRQGRLFRVHRGVYLVGRRHLTAEGSMLAAVLAGGEGASLAGRSALVLWSVLAPDDGPMHVSCPTKRTHRYGIRFHRSELGKPDVAVIDWIPLTVPARALLDLAAEDPGIELERALNEARGRDLLPEAEIAGLRARSRGHHGWGPLERLLDSEREPDFSRREAERRLYALIREARLPRPRRNVDLHGYEVDMCWPERRLIVEVDSYAFHSSRPAFERDRRKGAELVGHGLEVLRFTWRQIAYEQVWTIARIAVALGRAAQTSSR